ncbi:glucose-6-phosphate isomerase [Flavobacteriaceae bacterium]|nr:glucose-6-phosphate isomerase [Flavobacteriaceae bacterium]MDC1492364.1 glucose-6-phosphate isomerase [Flavobacteriaceae bacterium]
MSLKSQNPTKTTSWRRLNNHFKEISNKTILSYFKENPNRSDELTIKWEDFYVDFSKNRIDNQTINIFIDLLNEIGLKDSIGKYFDGEKINKTENRAVLHTALRSENNTSLNLDGINIKDQVKLVKNKIKEFSDSIISGSKKGYTGKSFTDIVNIGIGGSDLGPSMVVDSLKFYKNHLNTHFVSNIDGDHVNEVIKNLDPETTLFVIVSKTFTTQETLSNANTIRSWFLKNAKQRDVSKHFIAVSTNLEKVISFGIEKDNIFPMWNWVGGRFSLWSAAGITISLSIGFLNFESFLNGAYKMDIHFRNTDFEKNIPVVLACLGVWYNNFYKCESESVITYSQYLNQFASYLQQASMESNGKSIDRNGVKVNYSTGQIVWGEPGTNSQHAFFQLIHQGTKLIPTDFIGFTQSLYGNKDHQNKLISNFIAQTEALMKGKSLSEVELSDGSSFTAPYKVFEGNKPTNTILIDKLSPNSLGKLIALYEHKIFVQGIIWNIFSYDQFGVELGKKLANTVLEDINNDSKNNHDASTNNIIKHYKSLNL